MTTEQQDIDRQIAVLDGQIVQLATQLGDLATRTGIVCGKLIAANTSLRADMQKLMAAHNHNGAKMLKNGKAVQNLDRQSADCGRRLARLEDLNADTIYGHEAQPGG